MTIQTEIYRFVDRNSLCHLQVCKQVVVPLQGGHAAVYQRSTSLDSMSAVMVTVCAAACVSMIIRRKAILQFDFKSFIISLHDLKDVCVRRYKISRCAFGQTRICEHRPDTMIYINHCTIGQGISYCERRASLHIHIRKSARTLLIV